MKNLITLSGLLLCLFCTAYSFGQTDTIYLNNEGDITTFEKAESYVIATKLTNGYYNGKTYDKKGLLLSEGQFSSVYDSVVANGYFIQYDSLGLKSSEGNMANDKRNGEWKHYYAGTEKLWFECNYMGGQILGELKNYYPSGKLKRIETHYIINVPAKGKSYAEDGSEIPYTPFLVMPEPGYDISGYLGRKIRYPKECKNNNIEGNPIVLFIVNEEGRITKPIIIQKAHPALEDEAMRIVKKCPNGSPVRKTDSR